MKKLTFKKEIDIKTFEPRTNAYIDGVKTKVGINVSLAQDDSPYYHDIDFFGEIATTMIMEFKMLYDITDEEELSYRSIIGDLFKNV